MHATVSRPQAHLAAYCLQQTAEKLLKGWLIGQGWNLVKTHDLRRLLEEAEGFGLEASFFRPAAFPPLLYGSVRGQFI